MHKNIEPIDITNLKVRKKNKALYFRINRSSFIEN